MSSEKETADDVSAVRSGNESLNSKKSNEKEVFLLKRGSGVLMHLTSLPSDYVNRHYGAECI